jgi:hypothetical protein
MIALLCCLVLCDSVAQPYNTWVAESLSDQSLPETIGQRLSTVELAALRDGQPIPPYGDFTVGIRLTDKSVWVGSKGGLLYRGPDQNRWRLFHSRRWFPDNHVRDLAVRSPTEIYVQTSGGLSRLCLNETTLERKMAEVHTQLRRRHLREGLVGRIHLRKPGTLDAGWTQPDNDNDGLWTSLYVAAEAFRFAVTGDAQARKNSWESLQALMFLEKVTGIPGFAARSVVPTTQPKPDHGEWHRSADGRWWWKGDTSSDELDGHYFAHAVYFDLAATPADKEEIRQVVSRITDHILDHAYYYVGPSGTPTRWGVWAPEKLNRELAWIGDRGLNSLEILSHLKVADHIVGKARYAQAAKNLIEQHGYALNTVWQKSVWPQFVNHSDDQLAFLAYYPLLTYERDAKLREIYRASLERSWQIERPEHSPLFNFIYAACRQADNRTDPAKRPFAAGLDPKAYDRDLCLEWFRDVPADLMDWTVKNSDRQDIGEIVMSRHRRPRSNWVLNVAERPLMRWNGDPYELDGGDGGASRDDGTFILLPYWLGRYHRLLD